MSLVLLPLSVECATCPPLGHAEVPILYLNLLDMTTKLDQPIDLIIDKSTLDAILVLHGQKEAKQVHPHNRLWGSYC